MPRPTKKDKFFLYAPKKFGYAKGKSLLGLNHLYEGEPGSVTLKDLNDFLKEKNIDPEKVPLFDFKVSIKMK